MIKSEKFVSLANKRVNRAIRSLRLISNLSNKNNYEYTEEQARKISRALQKEINSIKSSFANTQESSEEEFSL